VNHKVILAAASLLSLLLTIVHLSQDVLLLAVGSVTYPIPVVVFTVWLYGTLLLADRLGGLIIMLFGGLIGAAMIVVHSKGIVVGRAGGLSFVVNLFVLSTSGWMTMILAGRGIWLNIRSRRATRRDA
jgi:hypothetical protein